MHPSLNPHLLAALLLALATALPACGGPDSNGPGAVVAPPPAAESTERPRAGSGEGTDELPEPQAPSEDGDW